MYRIQYQHQQAEKAEREARAELFEAVGERDDFVRRAARYVGVHIWVTGSGTAPCCLRIFLTRTMYEWQGVPRD